MSSVTIKAAVGCIDEHRRRVLVDKIAQLVAEHLDEPAQVQVRIRSDVSSAGTPVRASAPLAAREPMGRTVVRLCTPVRHGRFGRKVEA